MIARFGDAGRVVRGAECRNCHNHKDRPESDHQANFEGVAEKADHLSKRRARMLPVLAILYFSQQASFFSALGNGTHRDVDHFKIGSWVVLSLVLLLALATKGFWFQPTAVRDPIDVDSTRATTR